MPHKFNFTWHSLQRCEQFEYIASFYKLCSDFCKARSEAFYILWGASNGFCACLGGISKFSSCQSSWTWNQGSHESATGQVSSAWEVQSSGHEMQSNWLGRFVWHGQSRSWTCVACLYQN